MAAEQRSGLRERKKQTTRKALRDAALRLALERGVENVRVDDIAAAAGVSPRTYNNYFPSREQAIVAAVTADRESRVAAGVVARPAAVSLATAVVDAVVDKYADPTPSARDALLLITTTPSLRTAYLDRAGMVEGPLTEAVVGRCPGIDPLTAAVLAAGVAAAVRVALRHWLPATQGAASTAELVVPVGSLPTLLRSALDPMRAALDAVESASAKRPAETAPDEPGRGQSARGA